MKMRHPAMTPTYQATLKLLPIFLLALPGCNPPVEYVYDRHACGTLGESSGSESGSGSALTTGAATTGAPGSSGSDAGEAGSEDSMGAGTSGSGSTGAGEASSDGHSSGDDGSTGAGEASSDGHSSGDDGSTGAGEASSDGHSSSDDGSTGVEPPTDVPTPTAPCPTFTDGVVTFCPAGIPACRDALVVNADGASGGPLALHWHGTYESPEGLMNWDWAAQQIATMVELHDGLMVLPYADPAAESRPGTPFPWWIVCGAVGTQCERPDDFILADEIVACAVEQGLVDPQRLNTSGMSAGGAMTSHLVDTAAYFAGAVSWSGGLTNGSPPATPPNTTSVMVLHGGSSDLYCGEGASGPGGCYDFVPPSESLAEAVDAAGNFAFLCDHQAGHSASMGGEGAQFMAAAHRDGHPWEGYPFGSGGEWMLDQYCYAPGNPSPWE